MGKIKKIERLLLCYIFIIMLGWSFRCGRTFERDLLLENVTVDTIQYDMVFQDSVKQFIKQMNIKHPDIVLAQAILESSHFTSNLFKENNNMFGMKEATNRNTVALGTKNGYAYYKNWQHSIIDYALYQSTYYSVYKGGKYNGVLDRQSYLEKLSNTYAEDRNYILKLNKIIREE